MECNNFGDWLNSQIHTDRPYLTEVQLMVSALRGSGLTSGQLVLAFFEGGREWDILEKACLALELTVVSIDHSYSFEQVQGILQQMQIQVAIVRQSHWGESQQKSFVPLFKSRSVALIDIGELTQAALRGELAGSKPVEFQPTRPEALATVVFSSGTTGQPQPVAYTQAQYLLAAQSIQRHLQVETGLVSLSWLPLSNLFQRVANMVARQTGARLEYVHQPRDIMKAMRLHQPHMLIAVPLFFERVYQSFFPAKPNLRSRALQLLLRLPLVRRQVTRRLFGRRMRFFISGSAACSQDVLDFFDYLGLPIYEAYGLSENIVPIAANRPGDRKKGSVGRPLVENELKIAPDGEIWVRGPGVSGQYFGSDQSLLNAEGYYPTGDLGRLSDDGYLYLTGRKANTFKNSAGKRICPEPLEQAVKEATLADFSLILGPNQPWLFCVVNYQSSNMPKAEKIKENIDGFVQGALSGAPHHLRPRLFFITDFELKAGEMLTPNMKLKRMSVVNRIGPDLESLKDQVEKAPLGVVERLPRGQGYYYRIW